MAITKCPVCEHEFAQRHWELVPIRDHITGQWTGKCKCVVFINCTTCHAKVILASSEVSPINGDWRTACEEFYHSV